ncbi:Autotransporter beta-domain (plasmid) [Vibrio sp. B1REV9]|uniref:autotransporter family protein n=1 Tax=Vibrio sp. B1REV9 TaxID=2751179 RepID=UPI001AEC7AD3|nr:autotransporter outer membrane beta-barrel domain-containing protein [Vibrio sp. B1REV9]CAE6960617.1 Autotransporter beta-domain [Vibrio sp. B1REV9]
MKVFKKSSVAIVVSAALFPALTAQAALVTQTTECPANTQCETVIKENGDASYNGNDIIVENGHGIVYRGDASTPFGSLYLKKDITVSGVGAHAIHVEAGSEFKGNLNIEGGSVISQDDTAIKIDGNFVSGTATNPNLGIYLKGGTITGKENAIDFSQSDTSMRIDTEGAINGNILGNGAEGNKINFGYNGGAGKNAIFNGDKITGMTHIANWGNLTVIAQDKTILWEGDYDHKANATLDIHIGDNTNLNDEIIYIDGKATFNDNSTVKLSFTGSNINDLLGKDIVLIEAQDGIVGGDKVDVAAGSGFDKESLDASPLLTVSDSWLEQTDPEVNGGVIDNKLVASYDVNYQGGDSFVLQAHEGGATVTETAFAKYVVDETLSQHNATGSDASGQLLALLVSAGTDKAQTARLMDEITPDADGSEVFAALNIVDKIRSQADNRSTILRNSSYNGFAHNGWNMWTGLVTGYGSRDGDSARGYDQLSYGINVGLDRVFDDERLLGFSLAYVNANTDIDDTANSNDLSNIQAMIYSGWFNDRYFVNGNINVGYNTISSEREIGAASEYEGNTTAKADYDALQIGYHLTAGMLFDLDVIKLEPKVSYGYQRIRLGDYMENGSPASLKYDRVTYAQDQLSAGFSAYNTYQSSYGKLTPMLSVMGFYDMSDDYIKESVVLAMDPSTDRFVVYGDKVGGHGFEAKFNANLEMNNKLNIDAALAVLQKNDFSEATVNLNVSKRF